MKIHPVTNPRTLRVVGFFNGPDSLESFSSSQINELLELTYIAVEDNIRVFGDGISLVSANIKPILGNENFKNFVNSNFDKEKSEKILNDYQRQINTISNQFNLELNNDISDEAEEILKKFENKKINSKEEEKDLYYIVYRENNSIEVLKKEEAMFFNSNSQLEIEKDKIYINLDMVSKLVVTKQENLKRYVNLGEI